MAPPARKGKPPARKGRNKDSNPNAKGSGDAESGAPRSRTMPTGIWGPDGKKSTWKPRKKSTSPADGRESTSPAGGRESTSPAGGRQSTTPPDGRQNTRSSRPAASQGTGGAVHQATPTPFKSPPQSTEPPPKPDEVPLGEDVKIEPKMVEAVEQQTRGQHRNPAWHSWRKNRITASMAHQISHSQFANGQGKPPPSSYLKTITGETRGVKTRAMMWGIENEPKAALRYKQLKSKLLGGPVEVKECGLYIDPEHPWLAASPDGIVMDTMTGDLLGLEIKCPYKHRDHTVAEACKGDKNFCLELRPDPLKGESLYQLKTNHSYYTQVQCQMAVLGLSKVDFVVYTTRDIAIVPVNFDREFWDSTLAKLRFFYENAVLPHLQSKEEGGPLLRREE